jgi:transposase
VKEERAPRARCEQPVEGVEREPTVHGAEVEEDLRLEQGLRLWDFHPLGEERLPIRERLAPSGRALLQVVRRRQAERVAQLPSTIMSPARSGSWTEIRAGRPRASTQQLPVHAGAPTSELTAPTILCGLGDVTRLSASRKAVRCAGIDIGVHRSDRRSRAGKLTEQGSPQLRWALRVSPGGLPSDKPRPRPLLGAQAARARAPRASLTIARRVRRCFQTLRELGPHALDPVA